MNIEDRIAQLEEIVWSMATKVRIVSGALPCGWWAWSSDDHYLTRSNEDSYGDHDLESIRLIDGGWVKSLEFNDEIPCHVVNADDISDAIKQATW